MNRLRLLGTVILTAALFATLGCSDKTEPTGGTSPGQLVVTLITPNTDDGAILLTLSGGPIDALAATAPEHALFSRETGATSMSAVLVGDLAAGALLELDIPDGSNASAYQATILQVADRQNALEEDLTGYELTIAPS